MTTHPGTRTELHSQSKGGTWRHRLAVATFLTAIPLLLFGGTVTTLEAGMAIDGWLFLEPGRGDHFLLLYPVEKWFRDVGTFVEHTHRLFGTLVGLLAIATWLVTLRTDRRRSARWLAFLALLVVSVQGAIGGFRVLENSPELAFLHGAFAQLVFAVLGAAAVFLSPRWERQAELGGTPSLNAASAATPLGRCRWAAAMAYVTIFLGAWLRHGSSHVALGLHLVTAVVSTVMVLTLAASLRNLGSESDTGAPLFTAGKRLFLLLSAQLILGAASFWIVFVSVGPSVREVHESVFPTLHVLIGALLLAQLVSAAMWIARIGSMAESSQAGEESGPKPKVLGMQGAR